MAHCFPIRLPPRLHAGSDAYPGWSQSQCRLQRVFICTGFSTALTKFFGAYLNQNSRDWYSTARVSKRPSHKVNRLLTRAVLYRRPNVACYDLGVTPNNLARLYPSRRVLRPPAMSAGFLQHHCLDSTLKNGIRESWPFLRLSGGGGKGLDLQMLLRRRSDGLNLGRRFNAG